MIRLTTLEVYNSIFNITEYKNRFEFYNLPDEKSGGVSFEKAREEIEKDLDFSDITATDLQNEKIGPIIIKEYKEKVRKGMEDGGYMNILAGYPSSVFQDFESYLSTEIDLVEDDIRLVLDKNISKFFTYELQPRIYTFKDLSEVLFNILQHEYPASSRENFIDFDDISRKTKLVVRSGIVAIRFDEKSFFSTVLGFTPGWDYKHCNEYISQKL